MHPCTCLHLHNHNIHTSGFYVSSLHTCLSAGVDSHCSLKAVGVKKNNGCFEKCTPRKPEVES